MDFKQWDGFNKAGEWTKEIDVRGFIQNKYIEATNIPKQEK